MRIRATLLSTSLLMLLACTDPSAPLPPDREIQLTHSLVARVPEGYWSWPEDPGPKVDHISLRSADSQVHFSASDYAAAPEHKIFDVLPAPTEGTYASIATEGGGRIDRWSVPSVVDRFGQPQGALAWGATVYSKAPDGRYWIVASGGAPEARMPELDRILLSVRVVASRIPAPAKVTTRSTLVR